MSSIGNMKKKRIEALHTQLPPASSMERLKINANEKNNAPNNPIKIGRIRSPLTKNNIWNICRFNIIPSLAYHKFIYQRSQFQTWLFKKQIRTNLVKTAKLFVNPRI